jgi:hypothetical protein
MSAGKIYMGSMILCAAALATLLIIGGVELNPGPGENTVNRVAGGTITAVEMLSFKMRRVENGTATDVDLRDCGFWKRN